MAKFLNAKSTLKRVRGRKRLETGPVADAMRTLFVGTNWDLVSSKIGIHGGTQVNLEMTIQHFDNTPVNGASQAAFAKVFAEWVGHMGFDLVEWELTIAEVLLEKETVPMYDGAFAW